MARISIILFIWIAFFQAGIAYGQYIFKHHLSIEATDDEKMANPWAGGLNSVQAGSIDFDLDGLEDLALFDRTSNKLNTYRNNGNGFSYAPEYELLFPEEIVGWIIFADYNCDGKKDIFTHTIFGIKVYENVSSETLQWEKVADPLYTSSISSSNDTTEFNLQVNVTDIPAIADIDNDGDLDILVYNFAMGGFIRHHKNFSMENDGTCGLQYRRVSLQWGEFEECECDTFAFNGETCEEISGHDSGRIMHAGGKTMLLLDVDGNGAKDLLMSQEDCSTLYYLENKGTPDDAFMDSFEMDFPNSQNPAHFKRFPGAFNEDATGDGQKDLLVSPNLPDDPFYDVDFKNSVWLYENIGTSQNPQFSFSRKNFLQEGMIDQGWMAKPFFIDIDGDADPDMLVAANGHEIDGIFYGAIAFYENTGTPVSPKFRLIDHDYLNLSAMKWIDIKPAFADLDGDGSLDLVLPARTRGSQRASICYLANKGVSGRFDFDPGDIRQLNFENFTAGDNIYFYDVDKNGHVDILLGKVTGRIEYYRNNGHSVSFSLVSREFAGISDNFTRRAPSFLIADLDNNGQEEMAVLDNSGLIRIIGDFNTDSPREHTTTYYNPFEDKADSSRFGSYNQLALANLKKRELPLLAIGSIQGGVYLLENISENRNDERISLKVYPNPVGGSISGDGSLVTIISSMDARVEVFSLLGKALFSTMVRKDEKFLLDPAFLEHGIYLVRATASRKNSKAVKLAVVK